MSGPKIGKEKTTRILKNIKDTPEKQSFLHKFQIGDATIASSKHYLSLYILL